MRGDLEISVAKAGCLKEKPSFENLGFGKHFTDHMFIMDWSYDYGWHSARICPYQSFQMDPASAVLHYGQTVFEGLKAYKGTDGQIYLFRPRDNFERMNKGAVRMSMPRISVDSALKALKALVYLDRDWIPEGNGATLYIRPTMIGTDPFLGLKPSVTYSFFIIMSPVGAYYAEGFSPTRMYVSTDYARAVKGGVGDVKTAGNYGASMLASEQAIRNGYTQVLWLDACERKYIEEVGTSNIFFKIKDKLVTPPLGGSILGGITRDSVIRLARSWNIGVEERPVTIDEVMASAEDGSLQEAFATGTAAIISPIGELFFNNSRCIINNGVAGSLAIRLFEDLQDIQHGKKQDSFKWTVRVG